MRQLLSAVSEMGLLKQLASAVFWKTETTQRIGMLIDLNFEDSWNCLLFHEGRERIPDSAWDMGGAVIAVEYIPSLDFPDAVLVAVGCRASGGAVRTGGVAGEGEAGRRDPARPATPEAGGATPWHMSLSEPPVGGRPVACPGGGRADGALAKEDRQAELECGQTGDGP